MKLIALLLPLCLLALAPDAGRAGWGGGGCPSGSYSPGPVGPSMQLFSRSTMNDPDTYYWYRSKIVDGCYSLYLGEEQVGWFDPDHGYRSFDGMHFGPVSEPPIALPSAVIAAKAEASSEAETESKRKRRCGCCTDCKCAPCKCKKTGAACCAGCKCVPKAEPLPTPTPPPAPESMAVQNYGIMVDMMHPEGEHCLLNGAPVSKRAAIQAIRGDTVTDDSKLLRLTVIGPDAERQKVLDDLKAAPELQPLAGTLLVQDYPPDHWAVSQAGFVVNGHPTIYLQSPNGKVLHRQDQYAGALALAEAIRKANPDYKPGNDPNLNHQSASFDLEKFLTEHGTETAFFVVAIVLLFLLWRRK